MKIKLWKLIEETQDHYLWDGGDGEQSSYSCVAVGDAFCGRTGVACDNPKYEERLGKYLSNLAGMEIHKSLELFNEFPRREERQGARFLWLELAKIIAKEEEIEVHY